MTKEQAHALLELIADLYRVINQPDPTPDSAPVPEPANGRAADPQMAARKT